MKPKIYLAGGMHSNWQDSFLIYNDEFTFYDPRKSQTKTFEEYTKWDLQHVAISDAVICYIENTNPGIIGSAVECGYALGKGIPVIYIREPGEHKTIKNKYIRFIEATSYATCNNIKDAMYLLRELFM